MENESIAVAKEKPVIDMEPEQRSAIYRHLARLHLEEFQQYVEEIIMSNSPALLLRLINAIAQKVEQDTRLKMVALENMKLEKLLNDFPEICTKGLTQ